MWYVCSDGGSNMFFGSLLFVLKSGAREGTLTLFYFCRSLLEDYCMWQHIHYLDGSRAAEEPPVS